MLEPGDSRALQDVRLQQIAMIGPEGLAKLRASRVAVVGVGNIGSQTAMLLGPLGISMTLIDRDHVGPENLATQNFSADEVGLPKAIVRADALRRVNPDCQVLAIHAAVESLGLGVLHGVDLILAAVDSIAARFAINEIAMRLGVGWLDAALDGTGLSYTARVAAYTGGPTGACILCSHDANSIQALAGADGVAMPCPTWWDRIDPVSAPTLALSALGAAAGAVQSIWAIECLLGRGGSIAGREAHWDLARTAMRSHRLPANPDCVLEHGAFTLTPIGRPVEEVSVANTFRIAEDAIGPGGALRLNRRRLVTELRCPTCGEARTVYRVLDALTEAEARCPENHLMEPFALGLRDRVERHELAAVMGWTWADLGLPSQDVLTIMREDAEVHLLFAPTRSPSTIQPSRKREETR